MGLLKNGVGRPTNKTKLTRKIIKISLIVAIIVFVGVAIYAIKTGVILFDILKNNSKDIFAEKMNSDDVTKQKVFEVRDAVLRTANAYYKQGEQIQYDSYKRNLTCTPEDATSKHYCYVNCSGFVHIVYKNAIGKEVPDTTSGLFDYASKHGKSETVIAYSEDLANEYKSKEYYKERLGSFFLDNIKNIKPGDVIVWKTSSAHTMLVESVDIDKKEIHIIQAGGGAAETEGRYIIETSEDAYEDGGALSKETIKVINNVAMIGSNEKYEAVSRKQIAILRFATSYDYENITGASKVRKDFEGIYVAKISSRDNQNYTRKGRDITYILKVKNNGTKDYRDIVIKENIDENKVEVKSITFNEDTKDYVNYKKESNQKDIIRNISVLKPGEEITLKYTVKVKDDVNVGDIILSTGIVGKTKQDGNIYGIKTSRIETLVGKGLTNAEKTTLKQEFKKMKANKPDVSSRKFIKDLYGKLEIELDILGNNRNITKFNGDVKNNSNELTINYTEITNKNLKKYIYNNYYGLVLADESSSKNSTVRAHGAWNQNTSYELYDRARTLTPAMLEDGDVILTKTVEKDKNNKDIINDSGYIYFDSTLYRYNKDETKELSGESLVVFLRNLIGRDYIILRPNTK